MVVRTDELKFMLDDAANTIADEVEEVEAWEPWLVYLLKNFEFLAASLDPDHPDAYKALLKELHNDIETRLRKDRW